MIIKWKKEFFDAFEKFVYEFYYGIAGDGIPTIWYGILDEKTFYPIMRTSGSTSMNSPPYKYLTEVYKKKHPFTLGNLREFVTIRDLSIEHFLISLHYKDTNVHIEKIDDVLKEDMLKDIIVPKAFVIGRETVQKNLYIIH